VSHVEGSLAGEKIRKALDLTSWEAAQELVRMWEAEGKVQPENKRIAIRVAVQRYLEDAAARHLKEGTLRRLKVLLYDRLLSYSDAKGLRYPEELSLDELRRFRATWHYAALTSQKHLETLRSFLRFCHESGWAAENSAKKIRSPKVVPKHAQANTAILQGRDRKDPYCL
jgi:site-specific recombinase XerC